MVNAIVKLSKRILRPFKRLFNALFMNRKKAIETISSDLNLIKQSVSSIEREILSTRESNNQAHDEALTAFREIDERLSILETSIHSIEKLLVLNDATNADILQRLNSMDEPTSE